MVFKVKRLIDITEKENCFLLSFSCGNWAKIYKFGRDVYTVTSDNLHKSTLAEIKIDFQSFFAGKIKLTEIKKKWII